MDVRLATVTLTFADPAGDNISPSAASDITGVTFTTTGTGKGKKYVAKNLVIIMKLGAAPTADGTTVYGLDTQLKEWAEAAAARRDRVVAEVRSAVELDEARRARLAEVLTRVIGKPVLLQTTVDKAILGSLVVRVGDELFDGSIRSRLEQAREALGVA